MLAFDATTLFSRTAMQSSPLWMKVSVRDLHTVSTASKVSTSSAHDQGAVSTPQTDGRCG